MRYTAKLLTGSLIGAVAAWVCLIAGGCATAPDPRAIENAENVDALIARDSQAATRQLENAAASQLAHEMAEQPASFRAAAVAAGKAVGTGAGSTPIGAAIELFGQILGVGLGGSALVYSRRTANQLAKRNSPGAVSTDTPKPPSPPLSAPPGSPVLPAVPVV